jgi:hypothetical protein
MSLKEDLEKIDLTKLNIYSDFNLPFLEAKKKNKWEIKTYCRGCSFFNPYLIFCYKFRLVDEWLKKVAENNCEVKANKAGGKSQVCH